MCLNELQCLQWLLVVVFEQSSVKNLSIWLAIFFHFEMGLVVFEMGLVLKWLGVASAVVLKCFQWLILVFLNDKVLKFENLAYFCWCFKWDC